MTAVLVEGCKCGEQVSSLLQTSRLVEAGSRAWRGEGDGSSGLQTDLLEDDEPQQQLELQVKVGLEARGGSNVLSRRTHSVQKKKFHRSGPISWKFLPSG